MSNGSLGIVSAGLACALLLAASVAGAPPRSGSSPSKDATSASRAVFERRIRPIFASKNPSACSECHLSGVDLKNYIRPTEAATFAALRDQGMLDTKRPEESRILRFIRMSRPTTPLVTKQARETEYAAFRDWIVAAARNPGLAASRAALAPSIPNEVIRHTRIDAVVASFERNVWSQEGRCMGCHRPDNKQNIEKYGQRVSWYVPGDPEATMRKLIAQGDVNVDKPAESLVLLKPLNKVAHGGGVKMLTGDAGYKMFRAWLEDYAASVKGAYRTAADLPRPPQTTLVNMGSIMAVENGPAEWADKLVRVDVYPWDANSNSWAPQPVATGERGMSAARPGGPTSTNLIMFFVVPAENAAARAADLKAQLRPGRYRLRYYCDRTGRLDRDYTIPTDTPAFYQGEQEITAAWFGGWGRPVKVAVALTSGNGPARL